MPLLHRPRYFKKVNPHSGWPLSFTDRYAILVPHDSGRHVSALENMYGIESVDKGRGQIGLDLVLCVHVVPRSWWLLVCCLFCGAAATLFFFFPSMVDVVFDLLG